MFAKGAFSSYPFSGLVGAGPYTTLDFISATFSSESFSVFSFSGQDLLADSVITSATTNGADISVGVITPDKWYPVNVFAGTVWQEIVTS